jgi:hypothetical protein
LIGIVAVALTVHFAYRGGTHSGHSARCGRTVAAFPKLVLGFVAALVIATWC